MGGAMPLFVMPPPPPPPPGLAFRCSGNIKKKSNVHAALNSLFKTLGFLHGGAVEVEAISTVTCLRYIAPHYVGLRAMCRLYSVCVESTACGYIETMSITTLTIQLYTVGVAYYIVTFQCTVSVVRRAAVRLASLRLSCYLHVVL